MLYEAIKLRDSAYFSGKIKKIRVVSIAAKLNPSFGTSRLLKTMNQSPTDWLILISIMSACDSGPDLVLATPVDTRSLIMILSPAI